MLLRISSPDKPHRTSFLEAESVEPIKLGERNLLEIRSNGRIKHINIDEGNLVQVVNAGGQVVHSWER